MSIFRRKPRAAAGRTDPTGATEHSPAPPPPPVPQVDGAGIAAEVSRATTGIVSRIEARMERWFESLAARISSSTETTQDRIDVAAGRIDGVVEKVGRTFEDAVARIEKAIAEGRTRVETAPPQPVPAPPVVQTEPEPSFDEDNPDERYAAVIREFVGRAPTSAVSGNMVEVTVIGRLKNGAIAWFNESLSMFGTVTKDLLGEMEPQTDDRFRARVVSYPWGHVVAAVVPYSLVSPFAVRPVTEVTVESAGTPPDSVRGTPFERLRPGDIVLARVPYDGTFGLDKRGRTAKNRPSVFLRWGHDNYAWLRAIYDADGFVASNNLGIRLVDSHVLDKASVVRNAEYDIDPANILRHLGRLGTRDLNALNIEDTPVDNQAPESQAPVNYDRPDLDPVTREIPVLIAAVKPTSTDDPDRVMDAMLSAFVTNDALSDLLRTEGIHFAMVGHVFATLARSGGINVPKGSFRRLIDARLHADTASSGNAFELRPDENNHPVLWLRTGPAPAPAAPAARPASEEEPGPVDDWNHEPRFVLDEDYETPDLIVYDQESVAVLMRDRRVDLTRAVRDLRADGNAPAYIIGSDAEYGWAAFQQAARHRGWRTATADSRAEVCAAAARIAKEHGAEFVTMVGFHSDVIAELENNGHEVTIVSNLE